MVVLLFAACGEEAPPEPSAGGEYVAVDAVDAAMRTSIALRARVPTEAELAAVRQDPAALDLLVETWLDSPEFLEVLADYHAEWLKLRTDSLSQLPALGVLASKGYDSGIIYESTTNAPLKFLEHVVANDLPYTEILTADYTLADEVVATIYGLPYTPGGEEWQVTEWSDGRPTAGILSNAELWLRWESAAANFHRGRANLIAEAFLCESILSRDVVVTGAVNVADTAAVVAAVTSDPTCLGCHKVLDPLAAHLWGYRGRFDRHAIGQAYDLGCAQSFEPEQSTAIPVGDRPADYCYPIRQYQPENELLWDFYGLPAPAFYGQPSASPEDVGATVADDPRFAQCVSRRLFGYLTQVDEGQVPWEVGAELQLEFEASGYDLKALIKAIVKRDEFLARAPTDPADAEAIGHMRVQRPEQYARVVEQLTGYRWLVVADKPSCAGSPLGDECWGPVDLATSDRWGFRSMSGGIDGFYVMNPTFDVIPTKVLAYEQLAWEAAAYVVRADLAQADPAARRLLKELAPGASTDAALADQIAALHSRMLGELVDPAAPEVLADVALYRDVEALPGGNAERAWIAVVSGLLQDPNLLFF